MRPCRGTTRTRTGIPSCNSAAPLASTNAFSAGLLRAATPEPGDLEQEYSLAGGHVHHGERGLDQSLSLRPHLACARHATPLPGLNLCGSGSHPGGGITCAPAELAARAIG